MSTAESLRREGQARGEQLGEARGEARGRAKIVTNQLTKRFGALPAAIAQRIQTADTAMLDQWANRLLDAKTLDEVFAVD